MYFELSPKQPFSLAYTVSLLRRLTINRMDRWDGENYSRVLLIDGSPVGINVKQQESVLLVSVSSSEESSYIRNSIESHLDRVLGLSVDLSHFFRTAAATNPLHDLVMRSPGFRPPRLASVYETLINGISCQQLSLTVGITLLNRISANYGVAIDDQYSFPSPDSMANASFEDLRKLGFSGNKARSIIGVSSDIAEGNLDLESSLNDLDDRTAISQLCQIPGVGRWTAEYVALRGLGRLDVYPADDVGSQNKLQQWMKLDKRPSYDEVHQIVDQWTPYRGLIYFYLFLDSLQSRGLI